MMNEQKVAELFQSESFKAEVANITTAEELQKAFERHGVDMTLDEVIGLCGQIAHQMQSDDELDEDALENVSGGIAWALVGLGVVCLGAVALGIWNGYNSAKKGK